MNHISTIGYFKKAWETVKANFLKIIGAGVVLFVIQIILDSFSQGDDKNTMTPETGMLSLVATFVSLIVGVAVTSAVIKIVRGAPVTVNTLAITPTQVLRYFGVVVTLILMFTLLIVPFVALGITLGAGIFAASPKIDTVAIALIVILAIAVAIFVYLSLRLMFATYLVIDNKAGVFDSIKTSWAMTHKKVRFLLLFSVQALLICLLGLLALFVGLLVAIPVITIATGYLYVAFFENYNQGTLEKKDQVDE